MCYIICAILIQLFSYLKISFPEELQGLGRERDIVKPKILGLNFNKK